MQVGVVSEDIHLCNQLAVMCDENNFKVVFIGQNDELIKNLDCIIIDMDLDVDLAVNRCKEYSKMNLMIFGVTSITTKSIFLKGKEAGCLMVLSKSNFATNLADIISKSITNSKKMDNQ